MLQVIGIYRITNKINGKVYIGSSANIPQRLKNHLAELRNGHHRNGHLQNAFRLYGETAFDFGVVEYTGDVSDLIPREQYWIDSIGSDKLYNICLVADIPPSWKGKTISLESRTKISLANTGKIRTPEQNQRNSLARKGRVSVNKKPVKQIDLTTGNVVATFTSATEAGFALGLKYPEKISGACRSAGQKTAGYRWRYIENEIPIIENTYKSKAVEQIDPDTGEVIATFLSILKAASGVGLNISANISAVCKGKRKTAAGYGWRYAS
jgi:group I intron endonuclease